MDCLNNNITVGQPDANGLYSWLSVKAGQPSEFCEIKMHGPINMNGNPIEGGGFDAQGILVGEPGSVIGLKSEFDKSGPPLMGDDSAAGYSVGSRWIDTANSEEYVCVNNDVGAALWENTTTAGSGFVNSASNEGDFGIGVFIQKLPSNNLQFKNVNAGSTKIDVSDSAGTKTVDIDVVENQLTLDNLGGTLSVNKGGTGVVSHTVGKFLQGDGANPIISSKAVPTGDVVGTFDSQTLSNKIIDTESNTIDIDADDVTSGTFLDARISSSNVTQHEGAITIGSLIGAPASTVVGISDVQTLTNKTIDATNTISIDAADVVSGTFADARISSSNVTQHEGAITIGSLIGAPASTVVGISDVQTLTNKTIDASNTVSIAATDVVSGVFDNARVSSGNVTQHEGDITIGSLIGAPASTVVGISDVQTLTNKTIDATNTVSIDASDVVSGTFDNARISSGNVTQHVGDLVLDSQIGTLSVGKGGTGAVTHTSGNFLQGNAASAITAIKAVPTGDVVGTTDTQTLTNKTLTSPTGIVLNDMVNVNDDGGIGSTTGDRLTYVKNSGQPGGYSFIPPPINWTNVSVISGAIAFEDLVTPLMVTGSLTPQLINFAGALQPGSFLVGTNGAGRLTNNDGFTWSFNINFSCSLTGGNNTEWVVELFINGSKVSNPYFMTVAANGKYVSITGVWTQTLRGGDVSGGTMNDYAEIYLTRAPGSAGNADINSAYLSVTATKLLDKP